MKTTRLNSRIRKAVSESINRFFLNEAEWAFHYQHGGEHDMKPYGSETKYICYHETGQFGSGTYFSTFNTPYERLDTMNKYGDSNPNQNPNFIKIADNVYRVDMDLYKNLYRVHSEKEGDILHTMMGDLNGFYHKVSGYGLGEYRPHGANFNNALLYQGIKMNATALGLKCPSYMELTRMAQEHAKSGKEKPQSFSTVFMEYNGFNGVNVCGIDGFDTSRHGSVIYDLSKVSNEIVPLGKRGWWHSVGGYHTNTYATNSFDNETDAKLSVLKGELPVFFEKLSFKDKFRCIKDLVNSGKMNSIQIKRLDSKYYCADEPKIMNYVFKAMYNHKIYDEYVFDHDVSKMIVKYNKEYFVNYQSEDWHFRNESFLIKFLDYFSMNDRTFDNNVLKKYLEHLLSILNRDLTEDEKEYIENYYYYNN